jgi:hypothetical protein
MQYSTAVLDYCRTRRQQGESQRTAREQKAVVPMADAPLGTVRDTWPAWFCMQSLADAWDRPPPTDPLTR